VRARRAKACRDLRTCRLRRWWRDPTQRSRGETRTSGADAVCLVQTFYAFAEQLARLRGIDADHPRNLQKVTRTQ
jgi:fructoselysine-6-P-deglycase FrlB-like protein